MMTDTEVYAWIFLCLTQELSSLRKIIATADAINHAIPSPDELQMSFRWLQQKGLIKQEGKKYCLTESGCELLEKVSAGTIMETWENTTKYFNRLNQEIILTTNVYVVEWQQMSSAIAGTVGTTPKLNLPPATNTTSQENSWPEIIKQDGLRPEIIKQIQQNNVSEKDVMNAYRSYKIWFFFNLVFWFFVLLSLVFLFI